MQLEEGNLNEVLLRDLADPADLVAGHILKQGKLLRSREEEV